MRLGLAACVVFFALASGAQAAGPPRAVPSLTIVGAHRGDLAGSSVAVAGGRLIVGAPGANSVYVVRPGRRGRVVLAGAKSSGTSVAAVGDANGDGVADFVVRAPGASTAYVVFGGTRLPPSLRQLGDHGFEIDGSDDRAGARVAAAGDVNHDGLADVAVAAPARDGAVYVVFGKRDSAPVNLAALGSAGFAIRPTGIGVSVGVAGLAGGVDLSGDGTPDLAVSSFTEGDEEEGEPFVLLDRGGADTVGVGADQQLAPPALGWRAFGSIGSALNGLALAELAGPGGHGQLAIGAPGDGCIGRCGPLRHTKNNLRAASGTVYVVRGQAAGTSLNLREFAGFPGYRIYGAAAGAGAGSALAAAGDLNGDGVPDLVVGAPGPVPEAGNIGKNTPGSAYVIYGRRNGSGIVDLHKLGSRGFFLRGTRRGDRTGQSVAAGQLLGSRRPDIVVGAPHADRRRGTVYVVDPARLKR